MTDHNAIDRDQAAIETLLSDETDESFAAAQNIYNMGGNSKSYATVTLDSALTGSVAKGNAVTGTDTTGAEVRGKMYSAYDGGTTTVNIQYVTSDIQESYVGCQVGALPASVQETSGCFTDLANATLNINGADYSYSDYSVATGNKNGRTIAGFSTSAYDKMYQGCKGCPYSEYIKYYEYYGEYDYANQWVTAAFDGTSTNFKNGNANFGSYGFSGRTEGVKKGTVYMNVYMYVIREMEDALDDCISGCVECNDDPVHAWDEAVAFYTGSMEGHDGMGSGKLLHTLADKRCQNYKTCGGDGDELEGMSKINYDIFRQFAIGLNDLLLGNCAALRPTIDNTVALMSVPLIQGTLRYAYKVDMLKGGEKEKAEGAVFAAAILPRVHACSASDAATISANMGVGASSTDHAAVKEAFENNYECMAVTCADIGGLFNEATADYYEGAGFCSDSSTSSGSNDDNTIGIALGVTFGVLALIAIGGVVYMAKKEKAGKPVFSPTSKEVDVVQMN